MADEVDGEGSVDCCCCSSRACVVVKWVADAGGAPGAWRARVLMM